MVTAKQGRFCKAYVANGGNGATAAKTAGYIGSDNTLRVVASENLTKPNVRKYLKTLTEAAEKKTFRHLMPIEETLARTTFLGTASLDLVLDDQGHFDIAKARATGGIYAIKRLRIRKSTRHLKDGTEEESEVLDVELRDKNASVELMGRHWGVWTDEIDDPLGVLAQITGIPKHLLATNIMPKQASSSTRQDSLRSF